MKGVPTYLGYTPDQFHYNFIQERNEFSEFINGTINSDIEEVLTKFNHYIDSDFKDKAVMWVGGGRAWYNTITCLYSKYVPYFSDIEKSSIVAGNYDVFFLCNDKSIHQDLVCRLNELLDEVKSSFKLHDMYKLSIDYRNMKVKRGKLCSISDPVDDMCTLFPCNSISLTLQSQLETRRKAALKKDGLPKVVDPKLLVYFETFVLLGVDVTDFRNTMLNKDCSKLDGLNYLNPRGLYLFAEFIKVPRKEKGLNVDHYRKELLAKILKSENVSPQNIYRDLIDTYNRLFLNTTYYEKYFCTGLVRDLVDVTSNVTNTLITGFVTQIRPYANALFSDLKTQLESLFGDDVFLVMVGGDAMRRYIDNITITSDFDTKLFINPSMNKKLRKKLEDFMIQYLSRFVALLINRRDSILNVGYTLNISEDLAFGYSTGTGSNQFRLRYLENSADFPINLFSIDFDNIVSINYKGNIYNSHFTVPFIDIAMQDNVLSLKEMDVVSTGNNDIPIASLGYILKDLETTYTSRTDASRRYWNNKFHKDVLRYTALKRVQTGEAISEVDMTINDKTNLEYSREEEVAGNNYSVYFSSKMRSERKKGILKHKIRFSEDIPVEDTAMEQI